MINGKTNILIKLFMVCILISILYSCYLSTFITKFAVTVPGTLFDVEDIFLEDILKLCVLNYYFNIYLMCCFILLRMSVLADIEND